MALVPMKKPLSQEEKDAIIRDMSQRGLAGFGNRVAGIVADEVGREQRTVLWKMREEATAYADAGASPPYCICWKDNPDCEWCMAYHDWLTQDETWRQEWRDQQ